MNVKPIAEIALCYTFSALLYLPDYNDRYKRNCDLIVAWCSCSSYKYGFHKHKIYYSESGRAFIRKGSKRIYLDNVKLSNEYANA